MRSQVEIFAYRETYDKMFHNSLGIKINAQLEEEICLGETSAPRTDKRSAAKILYQKDGQSNV